MKNPICITGMHRSGTSMVSRILNICGMYLGPENKMMPPGGDNPKGFWENMDIVNVNGRILKMFGGSWSAPPYIPYGWWTTPDAESFAESARKITEDLRSHGIWGFKDPRACFTLPFWRALYPDIFTIICLRDPLAVVRSLMKRDKNLQEEVGVFLWFLYNKAILENTLPENSLIFHYNFFTGNPKIGTTLLVKKLGWNVDDKFIEEACSSIHPQLNHHDDEFVSYIKKEGKEEDRLYCDALRLYQEMCENTV